MKKRTTLLTCMLFGALFVMVLCRPAPALAVSTVTISPAGNGIFLIQGIGIENAAGFEIDVAYDTTTLANPRVTVGPLIAGAMTTVNPNIPGKLRIIAVLVRPVKGSGVIATLTFDRRGSSPGKILSINSRLVNTQTTLMTTRAQVDNPSDASSGDSNSSQSAGAPAGTMDSPSTPTIILAGPPSKSEEENGVSDSQKEKAKESRADTPEAGREQQEEPTIAKRSTEGTEHIQEAAASEEKSVRNIFSQKSALDRFEEYRGVRTVRALVSLFQQENYIGFRQEPPVALSDGKSRVRVRFISSPGNKTASDVAVMGARLISMRRDPDYTNTWIVDLQPEQGAYQASLTVFQGSLVMVYPLTIAPKVNIGRSRSKRMTETDYARYLKERLAAKSPALDLNRDGKWDYRDDYILTANYLDAVKKRRR